jgi:hypothetical protein
MLGFPSGLVVLEIGLMILLASPMAMPRRRRRVVHRPVDVLPGTGPGSTGQGYVSAASGGRGWAWLGMALEECRPRG